MAHDDRSKATLALTKVADAQRQLDAAIRMFFAEEDELAIHTAAAAAYRVLHADGYLRWASKT